MIEVLLQADPGADPGLFLGVLPKWIGDLLALLGTVLGLPAIILFFLGKNNANRALKVDESGAEVSEFEALRKAYKDDKAEAETKRIAAELKAEGVQRELEEVRGEVDHLRTDVGILRRLINGFVRRYKITMTDEERTDFDSTKPRSAVRPTTRRSTSVSKQ